MAETNSSREIFTGVYRLLYFDGRGHRSERVIEARSISRWGDDECEMLAFCRERKAERTFMASRIGEMVDLETGEHLVELGGVQFTALERWQQYVVRNYLFGKVQYLADALLMAGKGVPPLAVVAKMLALDPPRKAEAVAVDITVLRNALETRYAEMTLGDGSDVVDAVSETLRMWKEQEAAKRQGAAMLFFDTLRVSPWPEALCHEILAAVGRTLSLTINLRRV